MDFASLSTKRPWADGLWTEGFAPRRSRVPGSVTGTKLPPQILPGRARTEPPRAVDKLWISTSQTDRRSTASVARELRSRADRGRFEKTTRPPTGVAAMRLLGRFRLLETWATSQRLCGQTIRALTARHDDFPREGINKKCFSDLYLVFFLAMWTGHPDGRIPHFRQAPRIVGIGRVECSIGLSATKAKRFHRKLLL